MILDTITLNPGLCVTLLDQTRHYFGGYYHVKILAYCDVPLLQDHFDNHAEFDTALLKMGSVVRFERVLEKMAVPESGIESVREQLMQTFRETTLAYMRTPDFALRFVRSEHAKHLKKTSNSKLKIHSWQ